MPPFPPKLSLQSPARGSINTNKRLEFILILLGMPVIMCISMTKALSTDYGYTGQMVVMVTRQIRTVIGITE